MGPGGGLDLSEINFARPDAVVTNPDKINVCGKRRNLRELFALLLKCNFCRRFGVFDCDFLNLLRVFL